MKRQLGLTLQTMLGFFSQELDMVQATTIQITDAQIKALPTTSIEIVPDPGTGLYLVPVMCVVEAILTGGFYTNITESDLNQGASDIVVTWGANYQNAFRAIPMLAFGGEHSTHRVAVCPPEMPKSDPIAVTDGLWANVFDTYPAAVGQKNFMISADNTGNFTGGGVGNQLTITCWYFVRTLGSLTN